MTPIAARDERARRVPGPRASEVGRARREAPIVTSKKDLAHAAPAPPADLAVLRASEADGGAVTWVERAYFAAVGVLAATVGVPAYFAPAQVESVLPFAVPPLHSRLIEAMYLSGLAIMIGGLLARRWPEVRLVPAVTAIWTGGLLLVTLLHLEAFDFATTQTRVWFGAYVAYPVMGIWLLARRRARNVVPEPGQPLASWMRWGLTGQGVVLTGIGLALLVAP